MSRMNRLKKRIKQEPAVLPPKERDRNIVIITTALSILIIGVLTVAAYDRNSIYHNQMTLWASIVKRSPEKRRAHENYGQALSTYGFLNEALQQFKTVMALPDDGSVPPRDLYREIGVVYFRLGLIDESIAAWQTGLRYAPGDSTLLNNLSIAYLQQQRFDEAAAAAQGALAADPTMPQALNTLGQISMMRKNYDMAVQYFLKAIDREPDVPARYWNAAIALQQAKRYDQSYDYVKRYLSMERDPNARQIAEQFLDQLKKLLHS